MDARTIDLSGKGKVSLLISLSGDTTEPYFLIIKEPGKRKAHYYRKMKGSRVNVNLPVHADKMIIYVIGNPKIESIIVGRLRQKHIPINMKPDIDRSFRMSDIRIEKDNKLPSAGRFYSKKPIIAFNPKIMRSLDQPTRVFVGLHEAAHYFTTNEEKADKWATIQFLNLGYNLSSAEYALINALKRSPGNVKRMMEQFKTLYDINQLYYT